MSGYRDEYRTSPCRACGEPMVWTVTSRGKKMPVDAEPGTGGSFMLDEREGDVHADFVPERLRGERTDLYRPHWSTCPHADSFRSGKR